MSTLSAQDFAEMNAIASENRYSDAHDFFHAKPLMLAQAQAAAPSDASMATDQGAIQFHLIGQKTTDPQYSDIMNENQDNLLSMGGLIHDYMHTNYPTVDANKLDIDTWKNVIGNLPDLAMGSRVDKSYSNKFVGTSISGKLLSMIADAIITDGASILTDFQSFLTQMGDLTFSVHTKAQTYDVTTCTYQSYLQDNGAGGYFDYGAIVLRQVKFKQYFMEMKSSCTDTKYVNVDMQYAEIRSIVQCRKIRKGGADHKNFKGLVNKNSTAQFKKAKNFFNGGSTPQADVTPTTT